MRHLTREEFNAMERLLANLLPHCDAAEEAKLLRLHVRLQDIRAAQSDLSTARERLMALQSQTGQ